MGTLIPLKPNDVAITWWIDRFVPNLSLWWWDDSLIPRDNLAMRVLDRVGSGNDPVVGDIATVNAFHTWAVHDDVTRIVVDDGTWITALSPKERSKASELQVRFNRGLCIPIQRFGARCSFPEYVVSDSKVVLNHALWASLPMSVRRAVIESELMEWDMDTTYAVPKHTRPHIADVANSFVLQEGVNCLAVVAYALTGNDDDLHQWMMPDVFNGILQSARYAQSEDSAPRADDVIVFRDDEAAVVHAAYVIQPDRILNKSGQTSFNPIAITNLVALQGDWDAYDMEIWRS